MSEDYSRLLKTHEKKSECFMTGTIVVKPTAEYDASQGEVGSDSQAVYLLGIIPRRAFITNAYIVVQQTTASIAVADLGTAESGLGSIDLVNRANLRFIGGFPGEITDASSYIATGATGAKVWLHVTSLTGNVEGKFVFVVEYTEYKLNTGKLTNIIN